MKRLIVACGIGVMVWTALSPTASAGPVTEPTYVSADDSERWRRDNNWAETNQFPVGTEDAWIKASAVCDPSDDGTCLETYDLCLNGPRHALGCDYPDNDFCLCQPSTARYLCTWDFNSDLNQFGTVLVYASSANDMTFRKGFGTDAGDDDDTFEPANLTLRGYVGGSNYSAILDVDYNGLSVDNLSAELGTSYIEVADGKEMFVTADLLVYHISADTTLSIGGGSYSHYGIVDVTGADTTIRSYHTVAVDRKAKLVFDGEDSGAKLELGDLWIIGYDSNSTATFEFKGSGTLSDTTKVYMQGDATFDSSAVNVDVTISSNLRVDVLNTDTVAEISVHDTKAFKVGGAIAIDGEADSAVLTIADGTLGDLFNVPAVSITSSSGTGTLKVGTSGSMAVGVVTMNANSILDIDANCTTTELKIMHSSADVDLAQTGPGATLTAGTVYVDGGITFTIGAVGSGSMLITD